MTQVIWEEGNKCPNADCCGHLVFSYPDGECRCHLCAPCSRCTSSFLVCNACGEREPDDDQPKAPVMALRSVGIGSEIYCKNPSKNLGNGKRIYDYDYDARSGSTMTYKGKYEGPVTAQDIIDELGDGTFGHRGPYLTGDKTCGSFTYTKITD